jgi:hypothetical protein
VTGRRPRRGALLTLVIGAALASPRPQAHHSIAGAYDAKKPVTITGVVRQFRFVNPHPWIEVDAPDPRGQVRAWRLELDNRSELEAIGMDADTLRPGDRVVVTGIAAVAAMYALYVRRLDRPADGLGYAQQGAVPVLIPPPR